MYKIIQNAIGIWDEPSSSWIYYRSSNTHDFVSFTITNPKTQETFKGFIDGGCSYWRTSVFPESFQPYVKPMFLTTNDKTEIIIERMLWGTYGKSGKDPFKLVPLVSCTTDHLENILKNIKDLNSYHKWTIETILSQRLTNKFINP